MSRRPLSWFAACLLVVTSCGSTSTAEPTPTKAPTTNAAGDIQLSTTPSSQWGDTASCPMPAGTSSSGSLADEGVDGVQRFEAVQKHSTDCVEYPMYPPVGGTHYPGWANCGFYSSPVPIENAVHSLEHGAVWITFSPDLAPAEVKAVRDAAGRPFVLANPYPALGSPIVMTAWGRQLRLENTSDPRFAAFVQTYVQGPQMSETGELGAPCTGAVGTPG